MNLYFIYDNLLLQHKHEQPHHAGYLNKSSAVKIDGGAVFFMLVSFKNSLPNRQLWNQVSVCVGYNKAKRVVTITLIYYLHNTFQKPACAINT